MFDSDEIRLSGAFATESKRARAHGRGTRGLPHSRAGIRALLFSSDTPNPQKMMSVSRVASCHIFALRRNTKARSRRTAVTTTTKYNHLGMTCGQNVMSRCQTMCTMQKEELCMSKSLSQKSIRPLRHLAVERFAGMTLKLNFVIRGSRSLRTVK